jgi:hypothetical protein
MPQFNKPKNDLQDNEFRTIDKIPAMDIKPMEPMDYLMTTMKKMDVPPLPPQKRYELKARGHSDQEIEAAILESEKQIIAEANKVSLANVYAKYPGMAAHYKDKPVEILFADEARKKLNKTEGGGGGLEFWPQSETGKPTFPHPTAGKSTALEFYDSKIRDDPKVFEQAIYGDLLHGMRDNPVIAKLRSEFAKHYTPGEKKLTKLQYERRIAKGENPEHVNESINDAWMRGYLAPDQNDEFGKNQAKSQQNNDPGSATWSPEQVKILESIKNYLSTGKE